MSIIEKIENFFNATYVLLDNFIGGAVVVSALSVWVGGVWAKGIIQKQISKNNEALARLNDELTKGADSYRMQLKKSELIFEKQYEAASDLMALNRSIPEYRIPEQEQSETYEMIAQKFGAIEKKIAIYISKHGTAVGTDIVDILTYAEGIAAEGHMNAYNSESIEKIQDAGNLMTRLSEAEKALLKKVYYQSSTEHEESQASDVS